MPQPTSVAQFQQDLLYFFFLSLCLHLSRGDSTKSVTAISGSIIIIMINDYEYYSVVSIHLSRSVHQDKNKDYAGTCH